MAWALRLRSTQNQTWSCWHERGQKGIIHRKNKASNALVPEYDGKLIAKVIDFGVAKAVNQSLTELTVATGLVQIPGTLDCMSPEQTRVDQQDVDTRADTYSLGVLL